MWRRSRLSPVFVDPSQRNEGSRYLRGSSGQANWINESGEVVGWAKNQGDQATFAFLWKQGALTELGPLKGEACSAALGINSKTQVVGLSAKTCMFDAADRHATLWENGSVIDLNTFLPSGADLQQLRRDCRFGDTSWLRR